MSDERPGNESSEMKRESGRSRAGGANESLPTHQPQSEGDASAWQTAPGELADLSLTHILDDSAVRLGLDSDDRLQRNQIRLHEAPPGFRALMGRIADEHWLSYSGLARVTLTHGMAILDGMPWIGRLRVAYEETRREGMDLGDADALSRLGQVVHYTFQQPRRVNTTLEVSSATAARISDLAMMCGVARQTLAVIAVATSLLTLRNNRGYRNLLVAEVEAFRRFVARRTKELRLRDAD